jgi:hypothetical protein
MTKKSKTHLPGPFMDESRKRLQKENFFHCSAKNIPAFGRNSAISEASADMENVLIPLPGFTLPEDFPWQVKFVSLVEGQLRRLHASGRFLPPRFLEDLTLGQYAIGSSAQKMEPDFLLVHDRRDGACWLWRFAYGLRFVMATEPVSGDDGMNNAENRKLLGP